VANLDVTCIGLATVDYLSIVEKIPETDSRIESLEAKIGFGGPAATAAVTLARLGKKVGLIAILGDDQASNLIVDNLKIEGVDTSQIVHVKNMSSPISQVIIEKSTGLRTIITSGHIQTSPDSYSIEINKTSEVVLLDQAGYKYLENKNMREVTFEKYIVAIDGGNPIPNLNLKNVKYYMPTLSQIKKEFSYGEEKNVEEILKKITFKSSLEVIFTDGNNGSSAYIDNKLISSPSFDLPIKSTLGAGDVFHGAFIDGILSHIPTEENLRRSNLCAALSCRAIDGQSGIPSREELEKLGLVMANE
jgi:sugar/nucleoside kinase (ribokinase family)